MDIIDKSQREYSYKEILHIIKKHSKLICLVCLSILFITTYFTLITKPIYKAESSIMISEDQSTMSMLDLGLDNERNYLKNEIQPQKPLYVNRQSRKYIYIETNQLLQWTMCNRTESKWKENDQCRNGRYRPN